MLKKFSVENFRNFNKPITLDLTKVGNYEFNQNCIKNNLINKSVLYGRNAEGKTNLGKALINIRSVVLGEKTNYDGNFINGNIANSECVRFEYEFQFNDDTIIFSYSKDFKENIIHESLSLNNKMVYDYNHQEDYWIENNFNTFENLTVNFDKKPKDSSILKFLINNSTFISKLKVLDDFSYFVSNMAAIRYRESENLNSSYFYTGPNNTKSMVKIIAEQNLIEELQNFIHKMGIRIELRLDTEKPEEPKIYTVFDNKEVEFLVHASSGTRVLVGLFCRLHSTNIEKQKDKDIQYDSRFFFIDEFDAYMHFELAEKIITYLLEQPKLQIIATTHNTDLMSNNFLRPDCFLIVHNNSIQPLNELTTRRLVRGHDLENLYHSGEFDV